MRWRRQGGGAKEPRGDANDPHQRHPRAPNCAGGAGPPFARRPGRGEVAPRPASPQPLHVQRPHRGRPAAPPCGQATAPLPRDRRGRRAFHAVGGRTAGARLAGRGGDAARPRPAGHGHAGAALRRSRLARAAGHRRRARLDRGTGALRRRLGQPLPASLRPCRSGAALRRPSANRPLAGRDGALPRGLSAQALRRVALAWREPRHSRRCAGLDPRRLHRRRISQAWRAAGGTVLEERRASLFTHVFAGRAGGGA